MHLKTTRLRIQIKLNRKKFECLYIKLIQLFFFFKWRSNTKSAQMESAFRKDGPGRMLRGAHIAQAR